MTPPDSPPLTRAVVLRGLGFGVAIALGAIAVWLIVTSTTQKRIEIGVLTGLWGLLLGAYSMFGSRRSTHFGDDSLPDDVRREDVYREEIRREFVRRDRALGETVSGSEVAVRSAGTLERSEEAAERRAYEARLEQMLRREITATMTREVSSLRAEIAQLRHDLLEKVGGQLRLERIETTRLIGSDLEALQHEVRQLKVAKEGGTLSGLAGRGAEHPKLGSLHQVVEPARVRPVNRPVTPSEPPKRPAERVPAADAAKAEPAKAEPAKAEPAKAEPAKPVTAKPVTAKPVTAKPVTVEAEPAKPVTVEAPKVAPVKVEPAAARTPMPSDATMPLRPTPARDAGPARTGPARFDPSSAAPARPAEPARFGAPIPPLRPPPAAPAARVSPPLRMPDFEARPPVRVTPPPVPPPVAAPPPPLVSAPPPAAVPPPSAPPPAPAPPLMSDDPFASLPRIRPFTDFELDPIVETPARPTNGTPAATVGPANVGPANAGPGNVGPGNVGLGDVGPANGDHAANGAPPANGSPPGPSYSGRRRRGDETDEAATDDAGRHSRGDAPEPPSARRRRRADENDSGEDLLARLLARETAEH